MTTTMIAPTTTIVEPSPLLIRVEASSGTDASKDRSMVVSDAPDEVHVHEYDYKADVGSNSSTVIVFVTDLPSIYEVELEKAHTVLLEIEVR